MAYVFISYSHQDADYARRLAAQIEGAGFAAWLDDRIDYGTQWPNVIQEKLDGCGALIVVMTPRAFASTWVQNELNRAMRKRKPVLPLLLEGDVWLSVEAIQYTDVRGNRLPPQRFYDRLAAVLPRQSESSPPDEFANRTADSLLRVLETRREYQFGSETVPIYVEYARNNDGEMSLLAWGLLPDTATPQQEAYLWQAGWTPIMYVDEDEPMPDTFNELGTFYTSWSSGRKRSNLLRAAHALIEAYRQISGDAGLKAYIPGADSGPSKLK